MPGALAGVQCLLAIGSVDVITRRMVYQSSRPKGYLDQAQFPNLRLQLIDGWLESGQPGSEWHKTFLPANKWPFINGDRAYDASAARPTLTMSGANETTATAHIDDSAFWTNGVPKRCPGTYGILVPHLSDPDAVRIKNGVLCADTLSANARDKRTVTDGTLVTRIAADGITLVTTTVADGTPVTEAVADGTLVTRLVEDGTLVARSFAQAVELALVTVKCRPSVLSAAYSGQTWRHNLYTFDRLPVEERPTSLLLQLGVADSERDMDGKVLLMWPNIKAHFNKHVGNLASEELADDFETFVRSTAMRGMNDRILPPSPPPA
ncbi:hypothetical protein Q5752_005890 [Cryptotrichosporon argae]